MQLKKVIENLKTVKVLGDDSVEVKDLKIDSASVSLGSLYICLSGKEFDGHAFIKQVEFYGAVAVITEKEIETSITQVIVKDAREAMSIVASNFYGHSDKKLKIIGVTGTNGKTTVTYAIKSILEEAGVKCGVIGTLGVKYGSVFKESLLTTPDPIELHKIFKEMVSAGVEVVAMEVSAHALALKKLVGINFAVGIFTNLTQDHLDFFGTMEEYKKAKLKFFNELNCKFILVNGDDETGREISKKHKNTLVYGLDNPADVFAVDIRENSCGTEFFINLFDCVYKVNNGLLGRFNVYNCLCAAAAVCLIGISPQVAVNGISNIQSVSGRLEKVFDKNLSVYIDYAHTPDGLYNALSALKRICKGRLICVFGCGGNRDKTKREIMGEISGKIADFTVITSDNSRYEEPMDIMRKIEEGILKSSDKYVLVQDRTEGIRYALNYAAKGDVILVAGKGSEQYQEILGIKRLYNDKDTITEIIEGKI